ncbi:MAG TPA: hypothetical protein GXX53_00480 [Tissierellia bacterium]|nr:hypothetical protein [Tissierellia bacterium]
MELIKIVLRVYHINGLLIPPDGISRIELPTVSTKKQYLYIPFGFLFTEIKI